MFDDSRRSHLPLDLIYLFPAHLTFNFSFHVLNDSRQNAITSDTNDSCKLSEEGSRGYFDDESGKICSTTRLVGVLNAFHKRARTKSHMVLWRSSGNLIFRISLAFSLRQMFSLREEIEMFSFLFYFFNNLK